MPRVFLIPLLFAAFSISAAAADWPEFLGPSRDNRSPETGLRKTLSKDGVPVVWQKKVGTGYSAPSILSDTLVLHHRIGDEEIIEALHAGTGKPIWRHAYPTHFIDPFGYNNGPRCSPLLTPDFCYTFGAEGLLLCLNLKDGSLAWKRDTRADFEVPEAFFGVGSTPILDGPRLLVMVGGQPNSAVVAFDARTGQTLWQNGGEATWSGLPMTGWPGERTIQWNTADPAFQKQASYCSPVLATIHGKRHVLCCTRQGLLSLDPETGKRRFAFWFRARQDSSVNAMTPIVENDCILISSAYFRNGSVLLRVQPDGAGVDEVWRGMQLEMHWSQPVLENGRLFGFSGRNEPDARFRCVDWADGTVRWDRFEGWPNAGHSKLREGEKAPEFYGRGSLILADKKLVALGEAGRLGIFETDASKVVEIGQWQVPGLSYPCWTGPVLSNRKLYLRDEGLLLCLDWADAGAAK
jgi:outer membrane protein assembly factor BamB